MLAFKLFFISCLTFLLLGSALAMVFYKYQSRVLFVDIQKQEKRLDHYEVEWGRLQLELTTLTDENRIERVAKEQLKLVLPEREKIIYLKLE